MVAPHARLATFAPLCRATLGPGARRLGDVETPGARTSVRNLLERPASRRNFVETPTPAAQPYVGDGERSFLYNKKLQDCRARNSNLVMDSIETQQNLRNQQASYSMYDFYNWHVGDSVRTGCGNEAACDKRLNSVLSAVRTAKVALPKSVVTMQLSHLGDPTILERLSACLAEMTWQLRYRSIGRSRGCDTAADVLSPQRLSPSFALDFDAFALAWSQLFRVRSDRNMRDLFDRMDTDCDGFVGYTDIFSTLRPSEINALARKCEKQSPLYQAALTEDEMLSYRVMIDRARSALDLAQELGVRVDMATERAEWQPAVAHIAVFLHRGYKLGRQVMAFHTS